jgi:hypothetical protein
MASTHGFNGLCPVCGDHMVITRMSCGACGSALEGAFHLTMEPGRARHDPDGTAGQPIPRDVRAPTDELFGRLGRLDEGQLRFVEAFLRCRGVIKNVEDMLGMSYPTVKARLASVLETMGFGPEMGLPAAERRQARRDILADLAAGRITTEEAHRLLGRASDDERAL